MPQSRSALRPLLENTSPLLPVLFALGLVLCQQGFAQAIRSPRNTLLQAGGPGPAAVPPSTVLQPALGEIQQTLSNLNIRHWRLPNSLRQTNLDNAASVERDLTDTVPGLLSTADANAGSVPALLALYRNIDALYDVLLRITENANLGGSPPEAAALHNTLADLEQARERLSDLILRSSQVQQNELARLRVALQAAVVAARTPVKTTVVDDWPERPVVHHHPRHRIPERKPEEKSTEKPKPSPAQPQ
jgi:hypothetical protein